MKTIKELMEERSELYKEAKSFWESANAEGNASDEDRAKFDDFQGKIEALTETIKKQEEDTRRMRFLDDTDETLSRSTDTNKKTRKVDNTTRPDESKRFKSFGEQLIAVAHAAQDGNRADPRLLENRAAGLNEAIASQGGFLVQQDFATELLKNTYETGILLSRCSRTPIGAGSNGLKINGIDETSRADGSQWGGVVAYWEEEAAEKTASKPKFRQLELNLKKLIGLCYATDELLDDATALASVVNEAFPNVFGFKADQGIMRGTGAGQMRGIINHPATVTVAKEVGQAATTIVAENIEKMYSRMWPGGLSRSVWTINQDCWPQIFQLHHAVGTGGVPMFVPAGQLSEGPAGTLLGRPIVPVEQCSTLGTLGDIMFCDFAGGYKVIDKGGIDSASSIHVRFIYDETTFRFVWRVDGRPILASTIEPAQGSNTVSPFVELATRS